MQWSVGRMIHTIRCWFFYFFKSRNRPTIFKRPPLPGSHARQHEQVFLLNKLCLSHACHRRPHGQSVSLLYFLNFIPPALKNLVGGSNPMVSRGVLEAVGG